MVAWEQVLLDVRLGQDLRVKQTFMVVEEGALPYYFQLGIDFLKESKFKINLEKNRLYQERGVEFDLRSECFVNLYGC